MSGAIGGIREGHESVHRIFKPLLLEAMNQKDSNQIVRKALAEAESKTGSAPFKDPNILPVADLKGWPDTNSCRFVGGGKDFGLTWV